MPRTFVIGDIHGCYKTLLALLARISPDPEEDTLVFLGDYIDRGPDSKKVVNKILQLRRKFPHCITLMGNHEQMLLRFLAGNDEILYLMMGGEATLASYGLSKVWAPEARAMMPAEHIVFFENLMPYWEDEENIYVHAGLQPGIHLSQQTENWLFWSRQRFVDSEYDFGKNVIFGHTPFIIPSIQPNKIGIDTGAVYGGQLTCLVLPAMEFVSVPVESGETTGG
jgi:serine/threonine protein phosphatase 1